MLRVADGAARAPSARSPPRSSRRGRRPRADASRNRRRPSPTSCERSEVTRSTPEWRTDGHGEERQARRASAASSSSQASRRPKARTRPAPTATQSATKADCEYDVRIPTQASAAAIAAATRPPHDAEQQRREDERDRDGQVAAEDRRVVEDRVGAEERAERVRDHQLAVPPDVVAEHLVDADGREGERERDLHAQQARQARPRRRVRDERRQQHAERQRVERDRLRALGRARAPGQRRALPGDEQEQREREAPQRQRARARRRAARRARARSRRRRSRRRAGTSRFASWLPRCTGKRNGSAMQAANGRISGQRWKRARGGDAERERDDQRDRRRRGVRAQRVGDAEPAEQRERPAGDAAASEASRAARSPRVSRPASPAAPTSANAAGITRRARAGCRRALRTTRMPAICASRPRRPAARRPPRSPSSAPSRDVAPREHVEADARARPGAAGRQRSVAGALAADEQRHARRPRAAHGQQGRRRAPGVPVADDVDAAGRAGRAGARSPPGACAPRASTAGVPPRRVRSSRRLRRVGRDAHAHAPAGGDRAVGQREHDAARDHRRRASMRARVARHVARDHAQPVGAVGRGRAAPALVRRPADRERPRAPADAHRAHELPAPPHLAARRPHELLAAAHDDDHAVGRASRSRARSRGARRSCPRCARPCRARAG